MLADQRPPQMQELVHQHAHGLHRGEGMGGPPLEMGMELAVVRIAVEHLQGGIVEQSSQVRTSLVGHGCPAALFAARSVGYRLGAGGDQRRQQRSPGL